MQHLRPYLERRVELPVKSHRNRRPRWAIIAMALLFGALVVIQCTDRAVNPVPYSSDYFPAAVGNSWMYVVCDTSYLSYELLDTAPAECGDSGLWCEIRCDTVTMSVVGLDSMTSLGVEALRWSFSYPDAWAVLGSIPNFPQSFFSVLANDSLAHDTVELFSSPRDTITWLSIPVPVEVGQTWCQNYFCSDTSYVVGTKPAFVGRRSVRRAFVIDRSLNEAFYPGRLGYSFVPYLGFTSLSYRLDASIGYRAFVHRHGTLALLEYKIKS
jgi:hypothetical protein